MDSSDDLSVILASRYLEYHNQVMNEKLKTKYAILEKSDLFLIARWLKIPCIYLLTICHLNSRLYLVIEKTSLTLDFSA